MKDCLTLTVKLDDEHLEEIRQMVQEKIAEFKLQLCENCPYKEDSYED